MSLASKWLLKRTTNQWKAYGRRVYPVHHRISRGSSGRCSNTTWKWDTVNAKQTLLQMPHAESAAWNPLMRAKEYPYSKLMQLPTPCPLAQLSWMKYKTTQIKISNSAIWRMSFKKGCLNIILNVPPTWKSFRISEKIWVLKMASS